MKSRKKIFLLSVVAAIFLLSFNFCFAARLEVNYPDITGVTTPMDTSTPLTVFVEYIFKLGMFLGFLAAFYNFTAAGVIYLMTGARPELLATARDRIWGSVSGLLLMLMIYLIITTISPHLAFLNFLGPSKIIPPPSDQIPGVYFYKTNDCSGDVSPNTANIDDFGTDLSNQINSLKIVNQPGNSFVSTMYSSPGLLGRCQDADPNNFSCQQVANFSSSASIHIFDFNPGSSIRNDGVYFYRKPFFNKAGGYLKISNADIQSSGFFGEELKNLTFQGVPIEEKICDKWDDRGVCINKKDPTLSGKEISSIKIAGSYIVYFVYFDPTDDPAGPWTYCQEFPTKDDLNKEGPKQFKWENTPNQEHLPNWIYIYPVK